MKYRCKQSGNIIELNNPYDIESMKGNENYEVVEDGLQKEQETAEKRQVLKLKRNERAV